MVEPIKKNPFKESAMKLAKRHKNYRKFKDELIECYSYEIKRKWLNNKLDKIKKAEREIKKQEKNLFK